MRPMHHGSLYEYLVISVLLQEELRTLKVGYRAKSLKKISDTFAKSEIDEFKLRDLSNDELEKELLKLYGVGPASVWILMFEVFNRMDYLKHISPWEQKIYTKLFFNKDYEREFVVIDKMISYFDRKWGKWKNLAVNYVWEDLWWKRKNEHIPWLEKLIRV